MVLPLDGFNTCQKVTISFFNEKGSFQLLMEVYDVDNNLDDTHVDSVSGYLYID